jgi:hypothetical protein
LALVGMRNFPLIHKVVYLELELTGGQYETIIKDGLDLHGICKLDDGVLKVAGFAKCRNISGGIYDLIGIRSLRRTCTGSVDEVQAFKWRTSGKS